MIKHLKVYLSRVNTLHNVNSNASETSPANGMKKKQLKFKERVKVKFKLNIKN